MPAKSAKQEKFMQAVANNPKFAKKVGVPVTVGQEFTKSGVGMKKTVKKMAMGGMGGMGKAVGAKAPPKGSSAMPAFAKPYAQSMMKQAQAKGSSAMPAFAKPYAQSMMKQAQAKGPSAMAAKKIAGAGAGMAKAVMGKKAGGLAAGHKQADGVAKKGKTKAMQVKMAGGGKTKKYC